MAAAKNPHADQLQSELDRCHHAPKPAPGHPTIVQHLEEAFVHALAGSVKDAEELLEKADTEISRFPALAEREFAILKARVHAVLSGKPAAKSA